MRKDKVSLKIFLEPQIFKKKNENTNHKMTKFPHLPSKNIVEVAIFFILFVF